MFRQGAPVRRLEPTKGGRGNVEGEIEKLVYCKKCLTNLIYRYILEESKGGKQMPITLEITGEGEEKVVKIKIECECGTTTEHSALYESFFVVRNNLTEKKEDWGLNFSCSNPRCNKAYIVKSNGDYGIEKKRQYIPSVRPHYPYLKRV